MNGHQVLLEQEVAKNWTATENLEEQLEDAEGDCKVSSEDEELSEEAEHQAVLAYEYQYDEIGNVIRIDNLDTGIAKKLYWNAWNQLLRVEEEDQIWTAIYDALGRRLLVRSECEGKKSDKSYFDPEVEFLEIGLEVKGRKIWKLYEPDLNGAYGGLNGVGGLDALDETSSQSLYLIN